MKKDDGAHESEGIRAEERMEMWVRRREALKDGGSWPEEPPGAGYGTVDEREEGSETVTEQERTTRHEKQLVGTREGYGRWSLLGRPTTVG